MKPLPTILLSALAGLFAWAVTIVLRVGPTTLLITIALFVLLPAGLLIALGSSVAAASLGFWIGNRLEKLWMTDIPLRIALSAAISIGLGIALGFTVSPIDKTPTFW